MSEQYTRGQLVETPEGPGTVCFVRMAAPDYREVEVVSVLLHARWTEAIQGRYHGTVFPAAQVKPGRSEEP